ncbi:glycosyltransferase [Duganella sp. CT11-72]|uniref:glycosyltransferase n=1 Tax=Duganella sp. CT11-72 TaxID=3243052 RepID=UPI0039B07139
MRIVLDLQACQGSSMHRGIGRYSMALAQAMLRQGPGHDYRIVLNGHFPDSVAQLRRALDGVLPQSQISTYELPVPLWEQERGNSWRLRAAEQLREYHLASLRPDVVHMSSLFEGLGENACGSVLHSRGEFDTAVTLYDLIPLIRKQTYLTDPGVASWYYRKLQSLKNAELLLAISGHSKREAMDALQLPDERIVNISSAVDDIFQQRAIAPEAAEALRRRYGLTRPFIMYTGGIDYRKNIDGLIEAFSLLPYELRSRYQLAVVCSVTDAARLQLQQLAARFRLADDELVLTGFVPDDDLVTLYNLTDLFVFPSLQEGFGLPALEAMSCGAATIGSNNSSIPEVIGRADALFDPTRPTEIAALMQRAVTDGGFHASLREHGLAQARLFSWDASARKTLDAFEEGHAHRRQAEAVAVGATPARRPRLAYVSPLPPERSGIADHSAELLPELARYYEIEVVLDQPALHDTWAAANFPQRSVAWFDANAERYDRIVYHFGNSSFHRHMFPMLQRHPGVVVLHDFFLSGVVHYASAVGREPNAYGRTLYESHGYAALIHELQHGREASYYQYPCNKAVLDQASGVIVHSSYSRDLAEQWYGAGRADEWRQIPLLRVLPGEIDRAAARAGLGLGADDFVMCSFGLLAITKCNDLIVEAWLNSALADDPRCHLVFVGENNIEKFGNDLAKRIASHPRIKITGFASPELYRNYLGAADAAVQLRSRSRGETSATILDCLSYRLPTIINSHGSAVEVPAEITIKLPDACTEAELSAAMERLRQDRALAARLSAGAEDYMRRVHQPAHVGVLYRAAIEHFAQHSRAARYAELRDELAAIQTTVEPGEQDWMQVANCIAANEAGHQGRQLLPDTGGVRDGSAQQALLCHLLATPPAGFRVEPLRRDGAVHRYARAAALALIGRPELVLEDSVAELKQNDIVLRWNDAAADEDRALSNRGILHGTLQFSAPDAQSAALPALLPVLAQAGELLCLTGPAAGDAAAAWLPAAAGPGRAAARAALGLQADDVLVLLTGADDARHAAVREAWRQSPLARDGRYRLLDADPSIAPLAAADLLLALQPQPDWQAVLAGLALGLPALLAKDGGHAG